METRLVLRELRCLGHDTRECFSSLRLCRLQLKVLCERGGVADAKSLYNIVEERLRK